MLVYMCSQGVVQFKDLFVAPTFDELETVATGADGQLKKLNKEQLSMVQKKGLVTVFLW